jgi:hypothetical protein
MLYACTCRVFRHPAHCLICFLVAAGSALCRFLWVTPWLVVQGARAEAAAAQAVRGCVPLIEGEATARAAVRADRLAAAHALCVTCPAVSILNISDKNRRDTGKSQSIWTDSKMETPGSLQAAGTSGFLHRGGVPDTGMQPASNASPMVRSPNPLHHLMPLVSR